MKAAVEEAPKEPEDEKEKWDLSLLEAALYVAGRPLDLKTLGRIIRTRSKKKVQRLARMLMEKYNRRERALEVLELEDQRFVLQLKKEYASRVRRLAVRPLLTEGPLRTLAYIAYRQPVLQKQVIDSRGTHAYGHIKQLSAMGLVDREKRGRNKVLRATEYFADYFGLSHNFRIMKRQLNRIFDDITKGDVSFSEEQAGSEE
ncbi:MAG: SMC-Scp complex subunit ScpB [Candidatus Bathyarchaeota archaeon]|nr:SMC-Scp complex subunit ScpB [Candidatus Bathyarchaeota archaeon]